VIRHWIDLECGCRISESAVLGMCIKHVIEIQTVHSENQKALEEFHRECSGLETCAAPSTDLRDYGYAPGNYSGKCFTCEVMMDFVDKRCHCCKPCAQKKMDAAFDLCTPTPNR
jgi:hypothetical protein